VQINGSGHFNPIETRTLQLIWAGRRAGVGPERGPIHAEVIWRAVLRACGIDVTQIDVGRTFWHQSTPTPLCQNPGETRTIYVL
ncbi:MAG: hypothetical protein K8F26_10585, partial [Thiobacillus sp.]|nr:hypothetical protein [Thiobacillus sp.]